MPDIFPNLVFVCIFVFQFVFVIISYFKYFGHLYLIDRIASEFLHLKFLKRKFNKLLLFYHHLYSSQNVVNYLLKVCRTEIHLGDCSISTVWLSVNARLEASTLPFQNNVVGNHNMLLPLTMLDWDFVKSFPLSEITLTAFMAMRGYSVDSKNKFGDA